MIKFNYLINHAKLDSKQYQYDGVKWCINNELRINPPGNIRGGFIADEMGLGKTIMMIGVIFANYLQRTLIVLPPVLINQWFNEIFRITGHKPLLYYGNQKKYISHDILSKRPIVITSYHTLHSKNCILKDVYWSRVIFDEAHHLRNSQTACFKDCKKIKSRIRWLVTGTPIQNRKQDFQSLCQIVGMKREFYMDKSNLRIIGRYFLLRRTKQHVNITLPEVFIKNLYVKWNSKEEQELSESIHSLLPNICNVFKTSHKDIANIFGGGGVLTAMLRARQSCIMSVLMRKKLEEFCNLGMVDPGILQQINSSSKIDYVTNMILERKDNGNGKIIFCHFQAEIDTIADRLRKGGMKNIITYDGRNSSLHVLNSLSEPADALIIQIQTGCEGLNLQQNFSEIYFVSPHWNPFVEAQAIARCHRIGQLKQVHVFKFTMSGFVKTTETPLNPRTMDKYINVVQNEKQKNADLLLYHLQQKKQPNLVISS